MNNVTYLSAADRERKDRTRRTWQLWRLVLTGVVAGWMLHALMAVHTTDEERLVALVGLVAVWALVLLRRPPPSSPVRALTHEEAARRRYLVVTIICAVLFGLIVWLWFTENPMRLR